MNIFSFRIPPDFPWPKFDESIGKRPNRSSRIPLNTITNQLLQNSSMETISSPLCITKTEDPTPLMNSNDYHQFFINQNDFQLPPTNYPDQLQVIYSNLKKSPKKFSIFFSAYQQMIILLKMLKIYFLIFIPMNNKIYHLINMIIIHHGHLHYLYFPIHHHHILKMI